MKDVREQIYKCKKCGAEDSVKIFPNVPVPMAINCWSCKAGYGIAMAGMIGQGLGMFPVLSTKEEPHAARGN